MVDFAALVKFLFSTVLGYGVVFGAVILKVPQILNIVRKKSASGVSLLSNVLEILGYAVSTSWGIAEGLQFKDFGENVFVIIQLVVLLGLVGYYQRSLPVAAVAVVSVLALMYGLSTRLVDRALHEKLLASQLVLLLSSRVPQIYTNYRNRSTGVLAFLTYFLAFGGSGARLITTTLNVPWESGKATMLTQFGAAALLNGLILSQIWFYGGGKKASEPTAAAAAKKDKKIK